jgi:hypothetical protein
MVVRNRYSAIKASHDVSKSHTVSRLACWWIDVHPPGEAFVVTTAPTTAQVEAILWRYIGAAHRLPLTVEGDGYLHSEDIDGSKSFGVWPLAQAAQACFGTPDWPADRLVPQASIEFEVADADTVQVAADELKDKGFALLHEARTEPWGQTVARLQSSEGAIIGVSYVPSMHS